MNFKAGNNIDFVQLQIFNLVMHTLSGAPGSPVEGQHYYNSANKYTYYFNNTSWINTLDRSEHIGTQLANTISDFDTQVQTSRLDQMSAPITSVDMNSQKITSLLAPTLDTDGANKKYVDDLVNGTDWKESARCATTANITLSGNQTIDGITTVDGDRILVKDQTTGSENGIYVASTGAWSRSEDANEDGELTPSSALFIEEGTISQDTQYIISTNGVIIIGTTVITFIQLGAGVSYTAGNGIDISGSVISVNSAVVVRKFAQDIGDNVTTLFTITHNLNTLDVQITVREIATGEEIIIPTKASSTSQCQVEFAVAPTTNTYRVIVQG